VEAMKLMTRSNPTPPRSAFRIFVENGQPVEYGSLSLESVRAGRSRPARHIMFQKILVANAGDRPAVICACKELGISTVAFIPRRNRNRSMSGFADEASLHGRPGGSESYLNIPQ